MDPTHIGLTARLRVSTLHETPKTTPLPSTHASSVQHDKAAIAMVAKGKGIRAELKALRAKPQPVPFLNLL